MVTSDYTVQLEQLFQGPMDLLLHLVREQEVDIHEIQINRVIDGYLRYLGDLQSIDVELAGDFVLMAASLMAIKSRSLLPQEEVNLEEELDPRDELIQRLIEYRRFKEVSTDLGDRFADRSLLHPGSNLRVRSGEGEGPELSYDMGDLTAWDVLSIYSRLMRETLADRKMHIASDDRPMRFYVDQLVQFVKSQPEAQLRGMMEVEGEGELGHAQLVGTFCALLELMRLGVVTADQPSFGDEITIRLRPEHRDDIDQIVRSSGFDDERMSLLDEKTDERPT